MEFILEKPRENIASLARIIGYRSLNTIPDGEFNLVRSLGRNYPRFHLYLKKDARDKILHFSLHLDQKKPSYRGQVAHSGEYEGELVEAERARIEKILQGI